MLLGEGFDRMSDRFRQSATLLPDRPSARGGAEGSATGATAHTLTGAHQEAATTQIASVIELQAGEQAQLIGGGIQRHPVGAGHRGAGQMARPESDRPLLAAAFLKVEVHQSRGARHGCLPAEFSRG